MRINPPLFPVVPMIAPAPAEKVPYVAFYPIYASTDPKPNPGGISAMPADVQGGDETEQPDHDFTYAGTAVPVCKTPLSDGGATVHYRVNGTVGAVLWDGTKGGRHQRLRELSRAFPVGGREEHGGLPGSHRGCRLPVSGDDQVRARV
jgi:hypothetical protein